MSYFSCSCGVVLPLKLSNEPYLYHLIRAEVVNYGFDQIGDDELRVRFEQMEPFMPRSTVFPERSTLEDLIKERLRSFKCDAIKCPNCGRLHIENKFDDPRDGEFITYVREDRQPFPKA